VVDRLGLGASILLRVARIGRRLRVWRALFRLGHVNLSFGAASWLDRAAGLQ
jgi:hypothetical protein